MPKPYYTQKGRTDIKFKQIGVILLATLFGLLVGYTFSFIRFLERKGQL